MGGRPPGRGRGGLNAGLIGGSSFVVFPVESALDVAFSCVRRPSVHKKNAISRANSTKTAKLDPHISPAFRPPLSLPGGLPPKCVSPRLPPAHGAASHITGPLQLSARPSHTATVVATTSADLLRAILLSATIFNMARPIFITGTGLDESNTTLSCRNDVRGRLISRRGCSVYDVFQQLHGPGYSREEMDDVLRIPAVRNSLYDELRRQHSIQQQLQCPESAVSTTTTTPPTPQPDPILTTAQTAGTETTCYYHQEFGTRARQCRPPCSYEQSCYYCGRQGSPHKNHRIPCSHIQRT